MVHSVYQNHRPIPESVLNELLEAADEAASVLADSCAFDVCEDDREFAAYMKLDAVLAKVEFDKHETGKSMPLPDEIEIEEAAAAGHCRNLAHTPGPWYVASPIVDSSFIIKSDNDSDLFIAAVGGVDDQLSPQQIQANARLIAAAPELFKAVEKVLQLAQVHDPKTGYYSSVDPYELLATVRHAFRIATL